MRLKEQVQIVAHSKAWAKFKEIPVIQQGLAMGQLYWAMGATEFNQWSQKPENQQLIDMSLDLLSNEISWYADQQGADSTVLLEDLYDAYSNGLYNSVMPAAQNGGNPQDMFKMIGRAEINELSKHLDKLKIPTIVLAFKQTDAARVKAQLARLEKAVNDAIAAEPNSELKGRFQRATIGGNDYLTLKLDGKMIPWKEILANADGRRREAGPAQTNCREGEAA